MNNAQITEAITIVNPYYSCSFSNPFAAKLSSLWQLTKELRKMDGFNVSLSDVKGNCEMVKELPEIKESGYFHRDSYLKAKTSKRNKKEFFGECEQWQIVTLTYNTGSYSFPLPINTKFYGLFLDYVGIAQSKKDAVKEIKTIIRVSAEILQQIGKAVKFMSKDDLRPAMTCLCIDIKENCLQVVSTDAHRMYLGAKLPVVAPDMQILIEGKDAKLISKKKSKDAVSLLIFTDGTAQLNGVDFTPFTDAKFPNYRAVTPNYETHMAFNREQFANNVKQIIPYANKVTEQINLHLNGSIALHSEDVDFDFSANREMVYTSKNFPDLDIAFNGSFLLDICSVFKDKQIKMLHDGNKNTTAGIFTNDKDAVLIMPLMMKN